MARLAVKNSQQEGMCYEEIGLCARNIFTILSLTVETIGRALCDQLRINQILKKNPEKKI
jgi:hypothetical protein